MMVQVSRECNWDPRHFSEEMIKVGKEEAGISAFNKSYEKFQENQYKAQTRQLLELPQRKVNGKINQYHIIMIISTLTINIDIKYFTVFSSSTTSLHWPGAPTVQSMVILYAQANIYSKYNIVSHIYCSSQPSVFFHISLRY